MSIGLDKATAPSVEKCISMAAEIGATWWCAYIGGPSAGGSGWTPELCRRLLEAGLSLLPTYAGQQNGGTLTFAQGQTDADDACRIMNDRYGWGPGEIICLDIEHPTFQHDQAGCCEYVAGWVSRTRQSGYSPMVYANPDALIAFAQRPNAREVPDQVWAASWVCHEADQALDPNKIRRLPDELWPGARAWQYAGEYGDVHCRVQGLDVDISCANARLLTLPRPNEAIARYVRSRPQDIGPAVDNGGGLEPHDWDGLLVQDFQGLGKSAGSTEGQQPGRVVVVNGPNGPRLVRNAFYNAYLGNIKGHTAHETLGAPLDEEHEEADLTVQTFEHGRMVTAGVRIELS